MHFHVVETLSIIYCFLKLKLNETVCESIPNCKASNSEVKMIDIKSASLYILGSQ